MPNQRRLSNGSHERLRPIAQRRQWPVWLCARLFPLGLLLLALITSGLPAGQEPASSPFPLVDEFNQDPNFPPDSGVAKAHIALNEAEKAFLEQHRTLRVGIDSDWFPFDFLNHDGVHAGIAADILSRVLDPLGVHVEIVGDRPWSEILTLMQAGEIDLLAMASETPERSVYARFTTPYVRSPMVIITRDDVDFLPSVAALGQRSVAVVDGFASHEWLRQNQPNLNLQLVDSTLEGLRRVARGETFALADNLAVVTYLIRHHGLANLKVSGQLPQAFDLSIAVRRDWPILFDIIQKSLSVLPMEERLAIYDRWINLEITTQRDYAQILPFTAGLLLILAVLAAYSWRLYNYRVTLQHANARLSATEEVLRQQNELLSRLSVTDTLTGSFNRLKLDQSLSESVNLAKRYVRPLSLIMLDLDHFKVINDNYGHQMGDEILRQFSECARQTIRSTDIFGRWGGEEFLLICPETQVRDAAALADKIRQGFSALPPAADDLTATLSAGVVEYRPEESVDEFINRCDQQLYAAKSAGRNCVQCDCNSPFDVQTEPRFDDWAKLPSTQTELCNPSARVRPNPDYAE